MDCVAAIQMLHPPLFGFGMGLSAFNPGEDYRYAMNMRASLMLGWTALLLWADLLRRILRPRFLRSRLLFIFD